MKRSFNIGVLLALASVVWATKPVLGGSSATRLQWAEGRPGCTFSADDDGLYRYGLWTDDFGLVMAVDADELRKASHRMEPTFAVLLTLKYRGVNSLELRPQDISLEFVTHFHDLQQALAPATLSEAYENDSKSFTAQVEREIRKHPERKVQQEALLQEHQKDVQSAIDFLQNNSLLATQLDPRHNQTSGWLFFRASSKWIGDWKKQEEFVLHVPLANRTVEFPFALPPSRGDFVLRRRPSH